MQRTTTKLVAQTVRDTLGKATLGSSLVASGRLVVRFDIFDLPLDVRIHNKAFLLNSKEAIRCHISSQQARIELADFGPWFFEM